MKPKISVYLTMAELVGLKQAARRARVSLSRYAKERLVADQDEGTTGYGFLPSGDQLAGWREQVGDTVRKAVATRTDELKDNLHTVMAMLDQLVLSTLTHLPEIPPGLEKERIAVGARRHRAWQQQVADELRRLRAEINGARNPANEARDAAQVRAGA